MMSATASLGLVLLWDMEGGLTQIDKFLYSTDYYIKVCHLSLVLILLIPYPSPPPHPSSLLIPSPPDLPTPPYHPPLLLSSSLLPLFHTKTKRRNKIVMNFIKIDLVMKEYYRPTLFRKLTCRYVIFMNALHNQYYIIGTFQYSPNCL